MSFLQVFITTTLEGWSDTMDYIRRSYSDITIIYFILLIFLGNFFVMNMMLAVIKAKFTEVHHQEDQGIGDIDYESYDYIYNDQDRPFSYSVK
jgi:hypothetical protein